MKKYVSILFMAVVVLSCSKENVEKATVTSKDGKSPASAENCSGGSISAGQYFLMNDVWGSGAGWQCIWYNNVNSWGANAGHTGNGIKAYPAMVFGCHWGGCSSNTGLPKKISSLGNVHTWWTQSSSGNAYDAAYDIWFDPASNPGNRAAKYELMVWIQWKNTKPIAQTYDANGNAVPFASNVSLAGTRWNIYRRDNVFSFLLVNQSSWISIDAKPLIDYCVSKGWMGNSNYMTSVQTGWEIIQGGTFSTSSYGVTGI